MIFRRLHSLSDFGGLLRLLLPIWVLAWLAAAPAGTIENGHIILEHTQHGVFYQYLPRSNPRPKQLLAIIHGTPRNGQSARELAREFIGRWLSHAEREGLILVAPVFDTESFGLYDNPPGGYRGLYGRDIGADEFLDEIIERFRGRLAEWDGRFLLYGHSAGGQFANRYLVRHPERLKKVVLSAPGRYAFPDPDAPWPYGMGKTQQLIGWDEGKTLRIESISPDPRGWLKATAVDVTIVVGEQDTQRHPPRPAHPGHTRISFALGWAEAMNRLAQSEGGEGRIHVQVVPGVGHDSAMLTPYCARALFLLPP
jgi:pimeloyl-ACP methyl ester carboxylesterase